MKMMKRNMTNMKKNIKKNMAIMKIKKMRRI